MLLIPAEDPDTLSHEDPSPIAPVLKSSKEEAREGAETKSLFQKLKEESRERKEQRAQHVTHDEATRITGYGEGGVKSNKSNGKGDKRSLGALFFG